MVRYRRPILMLTVVAIACLGVAAAYLERQRRVDRLVGIIRNMPVGISAAEAEQLIGRPPDETAQYLGVVVNYYTMVSPSNRLAVGHGQPHTYRGRFWYCGPLTVSVWTDDEEKVVVRSGSMRPQNPSRLMRLKLSTVAAGVLTATLVVAILELIRRRD